MRISLQQAKALGIAIPAVAKRAAKPGAKRQPSAPVALLPPGTVLLALDVSSSAIGWAIFQAGRFAAASIIRAPASRPSAERIEAHTRELGGVLDSFGITRVAMEWQSPWRAARCRNATGLAVLGQAQGAAFWEVRSRGIPADLISERDWTKVGGWPASKAKRAERVKLLCPEYREVAAKKPPVDAGLDIADAIGLGFYRLSI
jgi:Holliday junction resolvasome RuvABC endonuclease subunit